MRKESLFQCRLLVLPQAGRTLWLARVMACHCPGGPAQTSGGCSKESRTRAKVRQSRETDTLSDPPPSAMRCSAPFHRCLTPPSRSSRAMPLPPSMCSVKTILLEEGSQASQVAEESRSGVRFTALPPSSLPLSPKVGERGREEGA